MKINEVYGKIEYLIVPIGTKFTGSGKLGLNSPIFFCVRTETFKTNI